MATIIEAPRPDDDKHWYEDEDLPLEFRECDTCRAKPGSPVLCDGCLYNRQVIGRLQGKLEAAAPPELREVCLQLLGEAFVRRRRGSSWAELSAHLDAIADVLRRVRAAE